MLGSNRANSCFYYLANSSKLFIVSKGTQNYITARTNMLMTYETLKDSAKTFETYEELASLIKGRGWYTAEQLLHASMVSFTLIGMIQISLLKLQARGAYGIKLISIDQILFIKGHGAYVEIHTREGMILQRKLIKELEHQLPVFSIRVHRSYLINENYIDQKKANLMVINKIKIPVSRN
ncbi:MAG: DNA-binding LytR/AlgR family response regulator [Vicingaceae bacterium]